MKEDNQTNLEQALQKLEEIVEKMETGKLPLEESLALFEQGVNLSKQCQIMLENIEQKIQILTEKNGQQTLTDFTEES